MQIYIIIVSAIIIPFLLVSYLVVQEQKKSLQAPADKSLLECLQQAHRTMEEICLKLPERSITLLEIIEEMQLRITDATVADVQPAAEYIEQFKAHLYEYYNNKQYFEDLKPGLVRLRKLYFQITK